MPTKDNCALLENLIDATTQLVEMKKHVDRIEQEIRVAHERLANRNAESGNAEMDVDEDWPEDEVDSTATADTQPNGDWWNDDAPVSGALTPSPGPPTSPEPSSTTCSPSPEATKDLPDNIDNRAALSQHDGDISETPWKRFDVLADTPPDHAFFSTPVSRPSRQFLARLQKEYRALTNSLPGTSALTPRVYNIV